MAPERHRGSPPLAKQSKKHLKVFPSGAFLARLALEKNLTSKSFSSTICFYGLDDGYKKVIITMDDDPFVNLEKGYKKINVFDFLLDDNVLENV